MFTALFLDKHSQRDNLIKKCMLQLQCMTNSGRILYETKIKHDDMQ